jgi:hypothetical protein
MKSKQPSPHAARIGSWTPVLASAILLAMLTLAATPAQAQKKKVTLVPGFVNSAAFVELAGGEESVRVEVSIHQSLIKLMCAAMEEDFREAICGLKAINAVIVEVEGADQFKRATKVIVETEKRLFGKGWERLAKVREDDADIRVLVLNDESSISGLVVMMLERGEGEVIFANVAGLLDLEAVQKLADKMNIPGLNKLEGF